MFIGRLFVATALMLPLTANLALCQSSRLEILAGSNVSWLPSNTANTMYQPSFGPLVGVRYDFSIGQNVSLITGLSYVQKGFQSRSELRSELDDESDLYEGKTRYHFLSIPLRLSLKLKNQKHYELRIEGGMSYEFLLYAKTDLEIYTYQHGRLIDQSAFYFSTPIALIPPDNRLSTITPLQYGSLFLFHPATAVSLNFAWKKRYVLRAFYEYHLYDMSGVQSEGASHLHAAGLTIGTEW
jgi:hypothetical protein